MDRAPAAARARFVVKCSKPRPAQEPLKSAQEASKRAQEPSESCPRQPKKSIRSVLEATQRDLGARSCPSAQERPRAVGRPRFWKILYGQNCSVKSAMPFILYWNMLRAIIETIKYQFSPFLPRLAPSPTVHSGYEIYRTINPTLRQQFWPGGVHAIKSARRRLVE